MKSSEHVSLSRRQVLQAAVAAGVGATLPLPLAAADAPSLITRAIPSSGERIPVMGIGTNAFRDSNYAELRAVLKRMHELGGRVIDTAAMYGESEGVIGRALAELGLARQMFLATKFNAPGIGNWRPEQISAEDSFERSVTRLKTGVVDLMMIHQLDSVEPLIETLLRYKRSGRVRYVGITTASPEEHPRLIQYLKVYPLDFVQVDYSLGNRAAASTVFPVAVARKIAVMVAVPLGGRRSSLMTDISNRQLPAWAADFDASSWSQFFLKYVVSHPTVTCAIPGSSKLQHLEDNQGAGRGRLPDAATRKKMEAFWDSGA
jgi:aryl-alcohol dehydrogenase-like predicted oxidoreductase